MKNINGLIFTVITRIGNTGFGAITAVTVAASFGSSGLGVFALFRTLPMFLMIFTEMGISHSYSYLINARSLNRDLVLWNGLYFATFLSLFQVAIWILLAPLLIEYFSINITVTSFYLLAGVAPLLVLQLNFVNYLRAISKIYLANTLLLSVELFITLFFLLVLIFDCSNENFLAVGIFGSYLVSIILMISVFVKERYIKYKKFDMGIFKMSLNFGLKSQLGNGFQFLNYRLDQLIVALFVGPAMLGVYVVATKAAELFRFFSLSIVFVLEPIISKETGKVAGKLVKKYYLPIFLINLLIISVGIYIGPKIIPVFFEQWSAESIEPFYILMLGLLFTGANGLIGAFSLGQGKPWMNTYAIGVALIFTIILDLILIPKYGIIGAAVASTTGFFISSCAFLYFFTQEVGRFEANKQPNIC